MHMLVSRLANLEPIRFPTQIYVVRYIGQIAQLCNTQLTSFELAVSSLPKRSAILVATNCTKIFVEA